MAWSNCTILNLYTCNFPKPIANSLLAIGLLCLMYLIEYVKTHVRSMGAALMALFQLTISISCPRKPPLDQQEKNPTSYLNISHYPILARPHRKGFLP